MLFSQNDINQYSYGDCNIFAIALSRLTNLQMIAITKEVIIDSDDEDDQEFECAHAALLIDKDTILDINGLSSVKQAMENCLWNYENKHYKGVTFLQYFDTIDCENISAFFASYDEELIDEATQKIKNSNILKLIKK